MKKILLVDDHAVVRQGLKQILSEELSGIQFGEAGHGSEALELIRGQNWDAVVLDMSLPGRNGLEVLKEIKIVKPKLPVFVVSMYPEDQFAVRVLKAGASGYLTKETAPVELVRGMRKVLSGGIYISQSLSEKMVGYLSVQNNDKPRHERLSDREFLILRSIASGKTLSAIARENNLSVKTISTYRARLLLKMNLANNAELTRYAFEHGLVEMEKQCR